MAKTTQGIGGLLVVIGVGAYVLTGADSVTALLPAILGAVIAVLGFAAERTKAGHHALHAAMVVALLGFLGTLMNVADIPDLLAGDAERPAAVVASLLTAILCAVLVALGVRSFVAARRERVSSGR